MVDGDEKDEYSKDYSWMELSRTLWNKDNHGRFQISIAVKLQIITLFFITIPKLFFHHLFDSNFSWGKTVYPVTIAFFEK